ncbi:hypothetical protein P43SY_002826 [Pythium insidiosum]|uniref:Uncharacterized protein n=1 Tax=Pythium insidiosum TaxID=114742 RepID=A0AAD5MID6_PYTIN|nr:hypothetical protein P43SY_002826 [Pythium insidiosum]
MSVLGNAMRYVTATVDATVVTPVASRLANSVANPYVLSYFIWEYIKRLTPQRARDLTRLLSTAVSDAVEVLGAEQAKQLGVSTKRLQDHLVKATVSPQGRDVLLNAVATAAKAAQALNTPETKAATLQLFETFQSFVDFFASPDGRHVIATAGECVTKACEVAASPEASVLLAEVATNICHALEVEALRRRAEQEEKTATADSSSGAAEEEEEEKPSPSSSAADTSFETESTMSDLSLPPTRHRHGDSAAARLKEKSATRSARIEKDVLLKMGVDPTMIAEIQRVLDRLREEEEQAAAAAAAPTQAADDESAATDQEDVEDDDSNISSAFGEDVEDDDSNISSAFGVRSGDLPPPPPEPTPAVETRQEGDAEEVILPEWHPDSVRQSLRRRHVASEERIARRHTFDDQTREMAAVLSRRRIVHGDLQPADYVACRAISMVLITAMGIFFFMLAIYLARTLWLLS